MRGLPGKPKGFQTQAGNVICGMEREGHPQPGWADQDLLAQAPPPQASSGVERRQKSPAGSSYLKLEQGNRALAKLCLPASPNRRRVWR